MNKLIKIYKGDEYRPKLEKSYEKDSFFCSVYERADQILDRLNGELTDLREDAEQPQSMGSNIIAFCGERGQGKTSAMQSFAYRLNKDDYDVMDLIEPSNFEKNESIVRVVLSKMFNQIQTWNDRCENGFWQDDFREDIARLSELFQKCYSNIEYMKWEKKAEYGSDDLETLMRLGNGSRLKEDLYQLVQCYLRWNRGRKGNNKPQYLVLQIDDVDLATKKIFELCEDLKNYLSIPNVIVLIATDYNQLIYAIYQKYLQNYEKLWELQKQIEVGEKCYEMATRYLEKMIPEGCRVVLPDLDSEIAENPGQISLAYKERQETKEGVAEISLLPEKLQNCKDIQEQILKWVYLRTGVVFMIQKGERHPFMPDTLRGLSQLVKMLGEMQNVDCDKAYEDANERDIARLRGNLLKLKQYFMDYGCPKHLTAAQKELLDELERVNHNKNIKDVCRCVNKYCRRQQVKKDGIGDYQELMQWISTEEENEGNDLRDALNIYYSIFLNEWYVLGLEELAKKRSNEEYKRLTKYLGNPVTPLQGNSKKLLNVSKKTSEPEEAFGYELDCFQFQVERVQKLLDADGLESSSAALFSRFCTVVSEKESNDWDERIFSQEGEKRIWDPNVDKLCFNVLNPLFTVLRRELNDVKAGAVQTEEIKPPASDTDTEEDFGGKEEKNAGEWLYQLRNILCNRDVQLYLGDSLEQEYVAVRRRKAKAWVLIIGNIYKKIDSWTSNASYLNVSSSLQGKIMETMRSKKAVNALFLSSEKNEKAYQCKCQECLEKYKRQIEENLGYIENSKDIENGLMSREAIEALLATKKGITQPIPISPEILPDFFEDTAECVKLEGEMAEIMREYQRIKGEYAKIIDALKESTDMNETLRKDIGKKIEACRELCKGTEETETTQK